MKETFKFNLFLFTGMFLAAMVAGFFLAYDRMTKEKLGEDLVVILLCYFLAVLVGGLALFAYRAATTERDLKAMRRLDLENIYESLHQAHFELENSIRELRASVGFDRDSDSYKECKIDPDLYCQCLKTLGQVQFVFRSNALRATDRHIGSAQLGFLSDVLANMDRALDPLLEEYEAEAKNVQEGSEKLVLHTLPELADFLGQTDPSKPFSVESLRKFGQILYRICEIRHTWALSYKG